jgi:hypothetical protein
MRRFDTPTVKQKPVSVEHMTENTPNGLCPVYKTSREGTLLRTYNENHLCLKEMHENISFQDIPHPHKQRNNRYIS